MQIGRSRGGFVTCVCALITADGRCRIANADHLFSLLEGREIELESNLPLGITTDVAYAEVSLDLDGQTCPFFPTASAGAVTPRR